MRFPLTHAVASAAAAVVAITTLAAAAPAQAQIGSTTAPARIHVGAAYMEVPITVMAGPGDELVGVGLLDPQRGSLGGDFLDDAGGGRWTGRVDIYTRYLPAYGKKLWDISGVSDTGADIDRRYPVELRAHSMAGMTSTRAGSVAKIHGSVRVFNNVEGRYQGWTGREVAIERQYGAADWRNIGMARPDWRGNFDANVTVTKGATVRLSVSGTATIWGAFSAAVKV